MPYKVFETNNFLKEFKKIQGQDKKFIESKLINLVYPQLKVKPHFGNNIKKLINFNPNTWRYRIGNYRLFYEIDEKDNTVLIIGIETRQNAY